MFHFYVSTYWLSILLKTETYDFYVSLLVSMFHFKKHWGRKTKTLWKRFKTPVGAIQKHWGSVKALPQCLKNETKNETLKSYVSLFEMIDIQLLYNKKWNMKDNSKVLKTYGYMWDKLQFSEQKCATNVLRRCVRGAYLFDYPIVQMNANPIESLFPFISVVWFVGLRTLMICFFVFRLWIVLICVELFVRGVESSN